MEAIEATPGAEDQRIPRVFVSPAKLVFATICVEGLHSVRKVDRTVRAKTLQKEE